MPMSWDTTTRRCDALNLGLHVVSVRRLSGLASRTCTSSGLTTLLARTRYSKDPCLVVTRISSSGLRESRSKKGAP